VAIDCLAQSSDDDCATPRDASLKPVLPMFEAEKEAADAVDPSMPVFDLTGLLCPIDACPVVIDGTVVYADEGHLNQAFTMTQVPRVTDFLDQVLGSKGGQT
jgi:hypothetical protein